MKQYAVFMRSVLVALLFVLCVGFQVPAGADTSPPSREEKDFYVSTTLLAMNRVKKAMPPAPAGWIVSSEAGIDPLPSAERDVSPYPRFTYTITYQRIVGLKEEKKRLDDAYGESVKKHQQEAKPLIEELIKHQTEVSLKLRKATRRKSQAEEKRLNEELEENGRKMRVIHEEIDQKIRRDVEPFLVKDTDASITISAGDEGADLQTGEPVPVQGAAFAVRREGERTGTTGWKEGRTLILYGEWQQDRINVFRAKGGHAPHDPKMQTIKIVIIGDKKRTEELLKQMDVRAILKLMK